MNNTNSTVLPIRLVLVLITSVRGTGKNANISIVWSTFLQAGISFLVGIHESLLGL